jgi:hypothetical protein
MAFLMVPSRGLGEVTAATSGNQDPQCLLPAGGAPGRRTFPPGFDMPSRGNRTNSWEVRRMEWGPGVWFHGTACIRS